MLTSFSASRVRILASEPLNWTLDGEAGGTHQVVEVESIHNALRIMHGM